ncbi:glycosyltransferase family 2 protein [Altererythrobacter xiamenensis]|nr:glycosyltransferase family 2 protein [Altererythrobacter xiamenensis]
MLSLVVPVLNEADAIREFVRSVDAAIEAAWNGASDTPDLEIIFVDDGSSDPTATVVRALRKNDARIKLISLSRNFGKEAALSAGLHAASGDAAIPMDVDLQDPPDMLRPMVEAWKNGAKVVNARRADRSADSWFKRTSSRVFYRMMNLISDQPIADDVGDFRLLDRDALEVLNDMTEHTRFNKGLFSWIGFETATVEYVRPDRNVGQTKWKPLKLLSLAFDGITSSTTLPLRVWTLIGALIAIGAIGYAGWLIFYTLVHGADVPGYASLMVAILLLGGLNLISLGLIGEYLGRVAVQVRGRPLYIIASTEGL